MPILPLYDTSARPEAWHHVTAPGGYEWWRFQAVDDARKLLVSLEFFDGDPFNPEYRTLYARYRRRPTRNAPPVPQAFPSVRLEVLENGQPLMGHAYPFGPFRGSGDRLDVSIPPHFARKADDGSLSIGIGRLEVPGGGSLREPGEGSKGLIAELTFRPDRADAPTVRELALSDEAAHYAVVAEQAYAVNGTLRLRRGGGAFDVAFGGGGRVDHVFGTGPIVPAAERWMAERRRVRGAVTG